MEKKETERGVEDRARTRDSLQEHDKTITRQDNRQDKIYKTRQDKVGLGKARPDLTWLDLA